MGIGKLFHRDKSDSPKETKSRSRATSFGAIDPSLQTSRYEAMPPAGLPQTGTYPLKGNNSTAAVTGQKSSFRHSMDNRPSQSMRPDTAPNTTTTRTSTTTTTTTSAAPPRIQTPKTNTNNNFSDYHFFDQDQPNVPDRGASLSSRQMQQDSGLEQDFSGMRLGDSATDSATPPPISYYGGAGSASSRIDPRVDTVPRNDPAMRRGNQVGQQPNSPSYGKQSPNPQQRYSDSYDPQIASQSYDQAPAPSSARQRVRNSYPSEVDEAKAARRASIPRKQVGTPGHAPSPSIPATSPVSANYPGQAPDQPPPPVPMHGDLPAQKSPYADPRSVPQQRSTTREQRFQDAPTHPQRPTGQDTTYDNSRMQPQNEVRAQQGESRHPLANEGRMQQGEYRHPSAVPQSLNYNREPSDNQSNSPQSRAPPLFPRAQPVSGRVPTKSAAQDVIQKAHTNTKDTNVIERIAPAVIQEQVIQKVHHKREEVITREIHTHDVYHRILPIIDVEVLPPRHFLPVEGGGLVEIGADEVPGRAKNWVIAETASTIPSDQPAPKAASRFTAREFLGREGDKVEFMTRDGIKRSEETWVHPPELETGGKETGQTWPMVFGREGSGRKAHGHSSSRDTKRSGKSRRSTGPGQNQMGQYSSSY